MILLDPDYLSVLKFPKSQCAVTLAGRLALAVADGPVGTTIVNVEEAMCGWLASIAKEHSAQRQVSAYRNLAGLFSYFAGYHIALFDEAATELFDTLTTFRSGKETGKSPPSPAPKMPCS